MKCLSVHQPWAYLLVTGRRKIEVRSWDTKYRGPILIHTGLTVERDEYERLNLPDTKKLNWDVKQLIVGAIIGQAIVIKTELVIESRWEELRSLHLEKGRRCYDDNTYCWFLEKASLFRKPIPYLGRLGLFDVSSELIRQKRLPINYTPVVIKGQTFYKPAYEIPD